MHEKEKELKKNQKYTAESEIILLIQSLFIKGKFHSIETFKKKLPYTMLFIKGLKFLSRHPDINKALEYAREQGLTPVMFTGKM